MKQIYNTNKPFGLRAVKAGFPAILSPFLILFLTACGQPRTDLKTVDGVDLKKYLGRWYQIAFFPNSFQDADCGATTADYSQRGDGDIKVVNTCYEDPAMKKVRDRAEGKAWVVDQKSNAKLKVRFFWPFSGNYWIILLDEEYRHAVVSDPTREYLWILSRQPAMTENTYQGYIKKLKALKFDVDRLVRTSPVKPPEGEGR